MKNEKWQMTNGKCLCSPHPEKFNPDNWNNRRFASLLDLVHQEIVRQAAVPHAATCWTVKRPGNLRIAGAHFRLTQIN